MKKSLLIKIIAVLLLITLVISIILRNSLEHPDYIKEALDKTKIVKVYDYKTKELVSTVAKKDVEDLITELNYAKWKESNPLNGDEKKYLFRFFADEDSEDIAEITIYESADYLSVNIPEKIINKVYKTDHNLEYLFQKEE